jgi:hypothetical protein
MRDVYEDLKSTFSLTLALSQRERGLFKSLAED